jgi:hypothetical protein
MGGTSFNVWLIAGGEPTLSVTPRWWNASSLGYYTDVDAVRLFARTHAAAAE